MNYARSKIYVLLFSVLVSLSCLLAWSQPWVLLSSMLPASTGLQEFSGETVAPALPGLVFLNIATLAVLAISGTVLRKILSIVLAFSGVGIFVIATNVISDPVQATISELSTISGINNDEELVSQVVNVSLFAWPFIASASGLVLTASAIVIFFTSAKWVSTSRKYDADSHRSSELENAPQSEKNIAQWDTLSKGTDPTTD
jgi:uncharacterized membrane protein (TIGR02234 family)